MGADTAIVLCLHVLESCFVPVFLKLSAGFHWFCLRDENYRCGHKTAQKLDAFI